MAIIKGSKPNHLYNGTGLMDIITTDNSGNWVYAGGGNDTIYGGSGDDYLYGEDGNDKIYAGSGNDVVDGGTGNDILDGGTGNDTILGGEGNDTLYGGVGNDTLFGGEGTDKLYGGAGNDLLDGGYGNDYMDGGIGNDVLLGGAGDDTLYGGDGIDVLLGDIGNDKLYGGAGFDTLLGGDGNDYMDGGAGNDVLDGGAGNDIMYGGDGIDVLFGNEGNDKLYGGAGNDYLDGWFGDDYADGGAGDDTILGWFGNDQLYGGAGNDFIDGEDGNDLIDGGAGNDELYGSTGNDKIYGGAGNDIIDGEEGNDTLFGDAGNDKIYISPGFDIIDGGAGTDTAIIDAPSFLYKVTFLGNNQYKVLNLQTQEYSLLKNVEFLQFTDKTQTIQNALSNAADKAPIALNGAFSLSEDTPFSDAVHASDTDVVNLTYVLVQGPTHGDVVLNSDGTFTYTPKNNYSGPDSFTFKAHDGILYSNNVAKVSLTITPVNDAPTDIILSKCTVLEDTPGAVVGTLTTIDPDLGDTHTYTVNDERFEIIGNVLKLKSGVSLDYEIQKSLCVSVTTTDAGINGPSISLTQPLHIIVTDFNEAPIAVDDPKLVSIRTSNEGVETLYSDLIVEEDSIFNDYFTQSFEVPLQGDAELRITQLGILSNDFDPDNDPITLDPVNPVVDIRYTINNNEVIINPADFDKYILFGPNQSFFRLLGGEFDFLAQGQKLPVFLTYQITDGHGHYDQAVMTYYVTGVNDNPVAHDEIQAVGQANDNESITIQASKVLANDTDVDFGAELSIASISGNKHFSLDGDGNILFTPGADFEYLKIGESITESFTYFVKDKEGGQSGPATGYITVKGVDGAPYAVDDSSYKVVVTREDGTIFTYTDIFQTFQGYGVPYDINTQTYITPGFGESVFTGLLSNDFDPENEPITLDLANPVLDIHYTFNGNSIVVKPSDFCQYITFDLKKNLFTIHGDNFSSSLAHDQSIPVYLTYQIVDGQGNQAHAVMTYYVTGVNDAPVAVDNEYTVTSSFSGNVITDLDSNGQRDYDPDSGETADLQVSTIGSQTSGMGTFFINSNGSFTYTPPSNLVSGTQIHDVISYSIQDTFGETSTASLTVNYTEPVTGADGGNGADGDNGDSSDGSPGNSYIYSVPDTTNGSDIIYGGNGGNGGDGGDGTNAIGNGTKGDATGAETTPAAGGNGVNGGAGGSGAYYINAGAGDDLIYGGDGGNGGDGGKGGQSVGGEFSYLGGRGGNGGAGLYSIHGDDGNDSIYIGSGGANGHTGAFPRPGFGGSGGYEVYGDAGNDIIHLTTQTFFSHLLVAGGAGTDQLVIDGSNVTLDLSTIGSSLSGIENIDLTGTGNNTLKVTPSDISAMSDNGTLTVNGNSGDKVDFEGLTTFLLTGTMIESSITYLVYTDGAITLHVQHGVTTPY